MNYKHIFTTLALSSALILSACGDKAEQDGPGTLNTEDIDESREAFEQLEDKSVSDSEDKKVERREQENKETGKTDEVRKSDALSENSDLKSPTLTKEQKESAEEYHLPDDVQKFKESNNANILQNMGYFGYDEDKYTSVKDKIYHRYVSGKKKEDKAEGDAYDNAVNFFVKSAKEVSNIDGIASFNKPSPEQLQAIEDISAKTFNNEDGYVDRLGLAQHLYGDPNIIGVTRDYDDKGLYQVQFEYVNDEGTPIAEGISYYFKDSTSTEQLQLQRFEYTIFGAKEINDNIAKAIRGE